MTAAAQLDADDIQGLVLYGYGYLPYGAYVLVHASEAHGAKAWLRSVLPVVTTAAPTASNAEDRDETSLNLAVTYAGLRVIGLPGDGLGTFPPEFREGSADPNRARILGDTGPSDPETWEFGSQVPGTPGAGDVHVLLMLFARTRAGLEHEIARHTSALEHHGLQVLHCYESERPKLNREQFGFHDGISQPAIAGSHVRLLPGQTVVAPGEFILGYPTEYQKQPYSPNVSSTEDAMSILPALPGAAGRADLGRNGTYLVFRKLRQDVGGFWRYFRALSVGVGEEARRAEAVRLAAKCVGRWPGGAPLTSFTSDDETIGEDAARNNLFSYQSNDARGLGCPVGAHIRRTNPRDSLPPGPAESQIVVNRHRLLRRGRPYGPCLMDPQSGEDDGIDRGLLFLAINANIRRQFEFVQQTWANNPNFGGLSGENDPVIGSPEIYGRMTIPTDPIRRRLQAMPSFVTTKGGAYFFLPSLTALRYLVQDTIGG